jgi:hypothetical protein
MTLDEARGYVGRAVVYQTAGNEPEYGVIAGVGEAHVFVRYGRDELAKATDPADLTLLPMTARQQAREDVRQMWQAAFGSDPS